MLFLVFFVVIALFSRYVLFKQTQRLREVRETEGPEREEADLIMFNHIH